MSIVSSSLRNNCHISTQIKALNESMLHLIHRILGTG